MSWLPMSMVGSGCGGAGCRLRRVAVEQAWVAGVGTAQPEQCHACERELARKTEDAASY